MSDALHMPGSSERDWTEDFPNENGNYLCLCRAGCGLTFFGHKRRVQCKICATSKGPRHED